MYSGHVLPNLKDFIEDAVNLDYDHPKSKQEDMEIDAP